MELKIAHPFLYDEGVPLNFVLSADQECGLHTVTFEGEPIITGVELDVAISAMLDDVAKVGEMAANDG